MLRATMCLSFFSSKQWIIIIKQYNKTIIRFSFCYIWNNQNRDKCYQQKLAVSEFPRPLYHNEVKCSAFDMTMIFHSHEKNPFSQERLYTWPHFESEGFWNSEVAYCDGALRSTRFHAYVLSVYWFSLILRRVETTD